MAHRPLTEPAHEVARRRVKELRSLRQWNQEELAQQLERRGYPINRATIAKIEVGKRTITLDEVLIFAVVFDVSPLHLIVPDHPKDKLEVTKKIRVTASKARRWFRGWEALPMQDADRYMTLVPR